MGKSGEPLPFYDEVRFNNHALELTLVQLKYPTLPRFSEEGYLVDFKEALAEEYPLIASEQPISIVISVQGISPSVAPTPQLNLWRFTSIDQRWSVVLSSESISLETRTYTGITDFSRRFAHILRLVANHLQPQYQLRFGLRYINEFRRTDAENYVDWQRLLNPDLLGLGAKGIIGGTVEQTIGEVRTRREDGILLIRHGFLKGTTVVPRVVSPIVASPIKATPFYLLDLDYYDEEPTRFDVEAPVQHMISYNGILYRVFRWAIGEGNLYQQLRGEP